MNYNEPPNTLGMRAARLFMELQDDLHFLTSEAGVRLSELRTELEAKLGFRGRTGASLDTAVAKTERGGMPRARPAPCIATGYMLAA